MNRRIHSFHRANEPELHYCLWMDAGVVDYKLCDRSYNCDRCPFDEALHNHSDADSFFSDRSNQATAVQGFEFGPDRFYHPAHTWARVEENGIVRIGLDDFGQGMLGPAYSISLPSPNIESHRGIDSPVIAHKSGVTTILSPVEGTVVGINQKLNSHPSLINRDPYGDGWMMMIAARDLNSCLKRLMYGEKARQWLICEIESLRSLIIKTLNERAGAPATLADGGLLIEEVLRELSVEQTRRIIKLFFPLSRTEEAKPKSAILVNGGR